VWDHPEGMQSLVFDGAGHGGVLTLPSTTVSGEEGSTSELSGFTTTRTRRAVLAP
jgi:hypothetical protein